MNTKHNLCAALAALIVIASIFSAAVLLARQEPVDISAALAAHEAAVTQNTRQGVQPKPAQTSAGPRSATSTGSARSLRAAPVDSSPAEAPAVASPSFNADAIFEAIQKVRVDAQGNVVLDHETLMLLERTLGQRDLQLDDAALTQLKELVEYALPGAGVQVAAIAGDYYAFLRAKNAYEEQAYEDGQAEDYEDRQRHLQLLRETWLGAEVASKLFAQTDAQAALMRANMLLAAEASLSQEERQQRQQYIQQQYIERVLQANGWSERYQQFVEQKAALAGSGHTGSDTSGNNPTESSNRSADSGDSREAAIAELWQTHFSAAEREKMLSLQIPVFGQRDN